jgi:hypothetical protein
MTLRIQPLGLPDRILSLFGKRRAVYIPSMSEQYGYYIARRENFFRALFRSCGKPLPEGFFYWEEHESSNIGDKKGKSSINS